MGGIVENVKGKVVGWLSHAFGSAQSTEPADYTFTARDIHALFHGKQTLIPANQLSGDYLLDQARTVQALMTDNRDPNSIEHGRFLLSYQEMIHHFADWNGAPLTIGDDIILPLYMQMETVPMIVDHVTRKQRSATHPGDIIALQKDIRTLEQFNMQLQSFLDLPDIQEKAAKLARQDRLDLEAAERHTPFPSQWKI